MYYFLLVILVIVASLLMVVVLMQSSKGGGLSGAFGGLAQTDLSVGTRQAANVLHKATIWLVTLFWLLTVLLVVIQRTGGSAPKSIVQKKMAQENSSALPGIPTVTPLNESSQDNGGNGN